MQQKDQEKQAGCGEPFPDGRQCGAERITHIAVGQVQFFRNFAGGFAFYPVEAVNGFPLNGEGLDGFMHEAADFLQLERAGIAGGGLTRLHGFHPPVVCLLPLQRQQALVDGDSPEPCPEVLHFIELVAVQPYFDKYFLYHFLAGKFVFHDLHGDSGKRRGPGQE